MLKMMMTPLHSTSIQRMAETAEAGLVKNQDICIGTVNVLRQKMITESTELMINIT